MKKLKIIITSLITTATTPLISLSGCVNEVNDYKIVQFDTQGGSFILSQKIEVGQTINRPENPTKPGCTFLGWYDDNQFIVEHDFAQPIQNDITIFAKWSDPSKPKPEQIILNREKITLDKGAIDTLFSQVLPEGASQDVTWKSSDPTKVTVSAQESKATIQAKSAGTATITAISQKDSSIKGTCTVTVKAGDIPQNIVINKEALSLNIGEGEQLYAQVLPKEASQEKIWKSDNENVATVDENGNVTAISEGTANISVYPDGYESMAVTCEVTVAEPEPVVPESVVLNKNSLTLDIEQTEKLHVQVLPLTASQEVIWESSDEDVVTVSEDGIVTAKTEGVAAISVTSAVSPNPSATCAVTVKAVNIPQSIVINKETLLLNVDESEQLYAQVLPKEVSQEKIWKSDNENVATVDENGNVTAISEGTANISVYPDGYESMAVTCEVTVAEPEPVVPESVVLNKNALTLDIEQTEKLHVQVLPLTASQEVVWESTDEDVVTVSEDGIVTAKTEGVAAISVYPDGYESMAVTCEVTVNTPPEPIVWCEVSFETDGGSEVASQKIKKGEKATQPHDPTKSGFEFEYWYITDAPDTPFVFETTPIQGKTTLYAKWTQVPPVDTYSVNVINPEDDGFIIEEKTVTAGDDATLHISSSNFDMDDNTLWGVIVGGQALSKEQEQYSFTIDSEDVRKATLTIPGEFVNGNVQIGFYVEAPHAYNFETDPWSTVCYYANKGFAALARAYKHESDPNWFIGKTRKISLNGQIYDVRVVGTEQDYVDANHEEPVALTFQFSELISKSSDGSSLYCYWQDEYPIGDNHDYWNSDLYRALNSSIDVTWINDENEHRSIFSMIDDGDKALSVNIKSVYRGINVYDESQEVGPKWKLGSKKTKIFCPTLSNVFSPIGIDKSISEEEYRPLYKAEGQPHTTSQSAQYMFYNDCIGDEPIKGEGVEHESLIFKDCSDTARFYWYTTPLLQRYDHCYCWATWPNGNQDSYPTHYTIMGIAPCFCI